MKIDITEQTKTEVQQFLDRCQPAITQLQETATRISSASSRLIEAERDIEALPTIESASDKDIQRRLFLSEKKRLLSALVTQLEESASQQKQTVATLSKEATELFRRAASAREIEGIIREKFISALPDQFQKDHHLASSAWQRSILLRELAGFFNPSVDGHVSAEEIAIEATRRVSLLVALISGKNIPVPGDEIESDSLTTR